MTRESELEADTGINRLAVKLRACPVEARGRQSRRPDETKASRTAQTICALDAKAEAQSRDPLVVLNDAGWNVVTQDGYCLWHGKLDKALDSLFSGYTKTLQSTEAYGQCLDEV